MTCFGLFFYRLSSVLVSSYFPFLEKKVSPRRILIEPSQTMTSRSGKTKKKYKYPNGWTPKNKRRKQKNRTLKWIYKYIDMDTHLYLTLKKNTENDEELFEKKLKLI